MEQKNTSREKGNITDSKLPIGIRDTKRQEVFLTKQKVRDLHINKTRT